VTGKPSRTPPRGIVRVRSRPESRAAELEVQTGPWARRFERLSERLLSTTKPIVWVCALPGSGKTRLLLELERRAADPYAMGLNIGGWVLLDDPTPEALRTALAAGRASERSGRRLVVASRPSSEAARSLLTPRLYGSVEVIDERDLFLRSADGRSTKDRELLAATGGWPLLVDGYLGRAAEMVLSDPTCQHDTAALAREVGTSARTLSRLFSSETQLSFKSWCQRARIAAAIERLSTEADVPVKQLASDLGYASIPAFSHAFRQVTGKSPTEFAASK